MIDSKLKQPWYLSEKILFRFFFIYISLETFPFPFNLISESYTVLQYYYDIWPVIVNWTGSYLFSIEEPIELKFTGSGDTTYRFLLKVAFLIISLVVTIIWSILDRRRKNYASLLKWSTLVFGFYAAYIMFIYGFAKVFYLQFRQPTLEILLQTFGQSSPMHLMWVFMGSSKTYTVFSGVCEVLAGTLLVFRRTRVLGALVMIGVMLNVFLMNVSYDVPVKLSSFTYMLMGIYIMMPKASQLLNVLVLNRPTVPDPMERYLPGKKLNLALMIGLALLAGYTAYLSIDRSIGRMGSSVNHQEEPPLYGIYEAETFVRNNDTIPPLITDSTRWRFLIIDKNFRNFNSAIKDMTGNLEKYNTEVDTVLQTLKFIPGGDSIPSVEMQYSLKENVMTLTGIMEEDTLDMTFTRYQRKDFLLHSRGYHWINEEPYNRYDYKSKLK